jgi:hypothetical protein
MTIEQRIQKVREVARKLPPLVDRGRRLARNEPDTPGATPIATRDAGGAGATTAPPPTATR